MVEKIEPEVIRKFLHILIHFSQVMKERLYHLSLCLTLHDSGADLIQPFLCPVVSVGKGIVLLLVIQVGESVTLTALPKEGTATAPYRYTYEYKKPGAASWKTIGKRGAAYKSVNFTTDTTGTYQARIYIQDASNYVTVKTFKVKVS